MNPQPSSKTPNKMGSPQSNRPASDHVLQWTKYYRTGIAASSSTFLATFLSFPLESVKTRIQSYPDGFFGCVRSVAKEEGFRGFWRGVWAPMFSVTVVRTVSFTVYQQAKYSASDFIGRVTGQDEPLVVVNKPGSVPTRNTVACFGVAGAAAGAVSTLIACPFELTKNAMVIAKQIANSGPTSQRSAISTSYQGKNTYRTAQQIVRNCGLSGLYAGFQLQMVRETVGTALYFMTYESGKQLLVKYQGVDSPVSPLAVALSGGFCGMISLVSTYPLDRVKTTYQRACLEQGKARPAVVPAVEYFKKASYQGLGVAAARSALTNAILFSGFEYIKKRIRSLPDPIAESESRTRSRN